MKAIVTYNNTKHELEIEQIRLDNLLDKKSLLHSKYFSVTSKPSETGIQGGSFKDKYVQFMIEYTKINKETGMSLEQELTEQRKTVNELTKSLDKMTDNLLKLQGLEYELYSQIVVKHNNITKAVEKTAEIYDCSLGTVWNCYNKKIKKLLKL